MYRTIVFGLLLLTGISSAIAQEEGPWSGKAGLGYLATSGNSDSASINANFGLNYDAAPWHHALTTSAIGASQENQTTAEAYNLAWKTSYDFSEFNYVFGLVDWNKDKFSGYDQQMTEAIGYGRRLLNQERHVLNLEAGLGARQSDLRDGTSDNEMVLRLGADYLWRFGEGAELSQIVAVESGSENTYLESVTAIKAALLKNIALVASYTVKHNSQVPIGSQKTDTFSAVSVEYAF